MVVVSFYKDLDIFTIGKEIYASMLYGAAGGIFIKGEYDKAISLLSKAKKYDPSLVDSELYLSILGRSYMYLKKYDEALPILVDAVKLMMKEENNKCHDSLKEQYSDTVKSLNYVATKKGLNVKELLISND
jgi:tetratricopeptide (TPR) repeat protein